jgi:hypothetical protein
MPTDSAPPLLVDGEAVDVSTVFLVFDHGFEGPPVLWETMVFGGPDDGWQQRYRSRAAARTGHAAVLARYAISEGLTDGLTDALAAVLARYAISEGLTDAVADDPDDSPDAARWRPEING